MKPKKTTPRSRLLRKQTLLPDAAQAALGIYASQFFTKLLQYEKIRSDRSETPISLLTIRVGRNPCGGVDAAAVVDALKARTRQTDAIGWLDAERIAVLLPATAERGAELFAEALLGELEGFSGPVEVSTYPTSPELTTLSAAGEAAPRSPSGPSPFGRNGCDERVAVGTSLEQAVLPPVPRWKRVLDVAGGALCLLLTAPLLILVAACIKIVSPGPVFFSQPRVGRGGREFRFVKFRTMHPDNDQNVHARHAADFIRSNGRMEKLDAADQRIFFGGNLLRVLCIDELPQLYNVMRGEMSLVGPRPCIPYEAAEYQRWHRHRFDILPGMTGLWQVSGKNKLSFAEMIRLDIKYQRSMSLWFDLLIMLRTIPTIFGLLFEAVRRRAARVRGADASGRESSYRGENA